MKLAKVLILAVGIIFSVASFAAGKSLYMSKTCWACHGKDGNTTLQPAYPKVAGQNKEYLINQMRDIKTGVRSNGQSEAMKGVMGLVSDDEIVEIADWLSKIK